MVRKSSNRRMLSSVPGFAVIAVALVCGSALWAQVDEDWLDVGSFWGNYAAHGGEVEATPGTDYYPALDPADSQPSQENRKHLWIGTTNFTDANGEFYEYAVAHIGPRVYTEEFYPITSTGGNILKSRIPDPVVTVDGRPTYHRLVNIDEVDPTMKADRVIVRQANSIIGVTVYATVTAFSQEYHDNYHILEFVFKNTGNIDADAEIENEGVDLTGVVISTSWKAYFATLVYGAGYPMDAMVDFIGDGYVDDNGNDHDEGLPYRMGYVWEGNTPDGAGPVNGALGVLGHPAIAGDNSLCDADTVGRLALTSMYGQAYIHVSESGENPETDDPDQPSRVGIFYGGDKISRGQAFEDKALNALEYALMHPDLTYVGGSYPYAAGHQWPHHADLIAGEREPGESWADQMAAQVNAPSMGHGGGMVATWSVGPWDLAYGDSIRVVYVRGFESLSVEAQLAVGRAFKASGCDHYADITFNGVTQDKNHWVLSVRDSLFQMVDRATANYESGYNIPQPPDPPSEFNVNSGVGKISMDWESATDPPGGWEIYRTRARYQGDPATDFAYTLVASLDGSERDYEDATGLERGVEYFYYIQAVGDVNTDTTGLTPTGVRLKSSRYYTQTYTGAVLLRGPGEALSDARVVPNPYNLASSENVRYPDLQDKLGFLDIPGNCTIGIYTETGELVDRIEHTDGTGDEYWNLTTESRQVIVSGIYFAVIQDKDSGDQIIRKFVIIR